MTPPPALTRGSLSTLGACTGATLKSSGSDDDDPKPFKAGLSRRISGGQSYPLQVSPTIDLLTGGFALPHPDLPLSSRFRTKVTSTPVHLSQAQFPGKSTRELLANGRVEAAPTKFF